MQRDFKSANLILQENKKQKLALFVFSQKSRGISFKNVSPKYKNVWTENDNFFCFIVWVKYKKFTKAL